MRPLLLIAVLPEQVHSNRKRSHPGHTWVLTRAEHGGQRGGIWAPQALCLLLSNTPVLGKEQHVGFTFKHFLFINIALNMGIKLCIILFKITWMLTAHNNKSLLRALRGGPQSHPRTPRLLLLHLPLSYLFIIRCPPPTKVCCFLPHRWPDRPCVAGASHSADCNVGSAQTRGPGRTALGFMRTTAAAGQGRAGCSELRSTDRHPQRQGDTLHIY